MQGPVSEHQPAERLKSRDGAAASQAIDGRAGACTALAWHPFSEFLASCSPEPSGGPRLHDLRDGACLHSYKGHRAPVTHVRFAPDGRLLASADADGRVLVRPSRLGYCAVMARKTSTSRLGSCLDGSSQARPHSAQWLEADVCSGSGACLPPAPRHAPHADGLAGQAVCSTVARRPSRSRARRPPQVWDLVAGRPLHDFGARRAAAACLAFHPRARLLAAAAADGTVALLGLEPAGPVATLGPDPAGARRPPCTDPAAPLRPCHGRLHGPGLGAAASGATRGGERGRRGAQA